MAISNIVLGGFGNGTVATTIALVVTRGYAIGEEIIIDVPDHIFFTSETMSKPSVTSETMSKPSVTAESISHHSG